MHDLYLETQDSHSDDGLSDLENSIHSSRFDFSSVHTQHGLTFCVGSTRGVDDERSGVKDTAVGSEAVALILAVSITRWHWFNALKTPRMAKST